MSGIKAWWYEVTRPKEWVTDREWERRWSYRLWKLTIGMMEFCRRQHHAITGRVRYQTKGLDKDSKWELCK